MNILRLFLLTWNVKNSGPDSGEYRNLINPPNLTRDPDIIAIGLQEVSFKLVSPEPWVTRTKEILADRGYVMIKKNQLVGILLMVLVKRDALLDYINVKTDYTRTGLNGLWGNKGAVSTRFDHKGVSIVITNSHLAAHDYNLETRISEYKKIYGGQSFEVKDPESRFMSIEDHDLSLWLGDLNFRLDDLSGQEILQKTVAADLTKDTTERKNLLESLLEHDQLSNSMRLDRAFNGYAEAPVTFSPTYKFTVWSNEYDLGRKPAWCDRILYKNKRSINASPENYQSHPEFSQSDHKPVSSFFSLTTSTKLRAKRETRTHTINFFTPSDWRVHHDASAYYTFNTSDIDVDDKQFKLSSHEASPDRETDSSMNNSPNRRSAQSPALSEFDWIGLYPANFTDLEEPISFVWANLEPLSDFPSELNSQHRPSTLSSSSSSSSPSFNSTGSPYSSSDSPDNRNSVSSNSPIFRVDFSELVLLKPGQFRLLYFNEGGQVKAMSEPFTIRA